jgi:hypothetical protein
MVTDAQVRRLMTRIRSGDSLAVAAAKADMDEKTARKYRRAGKLPSQVKAPHTWRNRPDAFKQVWPEIEHALQRHPGLQAKTLFEHLQRQYPGEFQDVQLRTLQRRIKAWRALEGPAKEVYFPQQHEPGQLSQSDFADMTRLGVTLQRQPFEHLIYHFTLTYSNWEAVTICFSESLEALSGGLQQALWTLGGVPGAHQTDCLSAAVHKLEHPEDFTEPYHALMRHYGLQPRKTNPRSPHENGDVEQRHRRFIEAVDQALMLRGHRDFDDQAAYAAFLDGIVKQLNAGRHQRLAEERPLLQPLPSQQLDDYTRLDVRVSRFSTISVRANTYSVHSRLIGEVVRIHLYAERLEIYYAQRRVDGMPRLRGKGRHRIQYRHIIDWLVRKPGAFAQYRYRDDLFPTTRFRIAYDALCGRHTTLEASREYLQILYLAAHESETRVDAILERLLGTEDILSAKKIEELLSCAANDRPLTVRVQIAPVDLTLYDHLIPSYGSAAQAVTP